MQYWNDSLFHLGVKELRRERLGNVTVFVESLEDVSEFSLCDRAVQVGVCLDVQDVDEAVDVRPVHAETRIPYAWYGRPQFTFLHIALYLM